ncbi:MAG: META domain-containing protein [Bacteroidota bacterium]
MKSILFTAAVFTFITATSSCGDTKKVTGDNTKKVDSTTAILFGKEWKLTELWEKKIASDSEIVIAFTPGQPNKVSGYTGCRKMNGSFELSNTSPYNITFSPLATIGFTCFDKKANLLDAKFLYIFPVVTRWYIYNENELTLFSKETKIATFTSKKPSSTEELKLNGTWELNYISGPRIAFDGLFPNKKPTIIFDFPKEEAYGNGSCNGYSVKVKVDGNKINFGDALSTMMACDGNGEPVYFKTLKTVTSYSIDDNTLTMIMNDIAVMRFIKQ